jgi:hypothetical protein
MSSLGPGPPFWETLGRFGIGLSYPRPGILVDARLFPILSVPSTEAEPFVRVSLLLLSAMSALLTGFGRLGISNKIFSPSVGTLRTFIGFSSVIANLCFD